MQPTNLADVIKYIGIQQQEKMATQIAEAQQKLVNVSYDKAATYTTVIIFGGYAGFFGIWQLTKEYLSKDQALWSALLILASLLSFVLFEVIKMILVTKSVMGKASILRNPTVRNDPQKLLKALNDLDEAQHEGILGFMVVWAVTVFISLSGAVGGASILGYAFISGLARVSSPRESHPQALPEPDVNLSIHPAPIVQSS